MNQNGHYGLKADKLGDNKVPYADTYSFGIAQALPSTPWLRSPTWEA